jgi:uncharacterized protein (TIGR02145 family)
MKKILMLAMASAAMLAACSENETPVIDPVLVVSPEMIEAGAEAGQYAILVTANAEWVAGVPSAATWCLLSDATGTGDGQFTVSVAENALFEERAATVTITSGELSKTVVVAQAAAVEKGVVLLGTTWATRNVDAPGAFAETPGDYGKHYQFNRADPGVDASWNPTIEQGYGWEPANDPCPEGWRLPTEAEINRFNGDDNLIARSERTASPDNWNTAGMWFGDNAASASAADPKGCVFFPYAGYREQTTGQIAEEGEYGYYFSRSVSMDWGMPGVKYMNLGEGQAACIPGIFGFTLMEHYAFTLRCVKE